MKFKLLIALLSCCTLLLAVHCSKDKTCGFQDRTQGIDGELTGFDATKCGCCWGWIFKPESGDAVLIGSWPDDFTLTPGSTSNFPIKVRVEFTEDGSCFKNNRKVIATKMELR